MKLKLLFFSALVIMSSCQKAPQSIKNSQSTNEPLLVNVKINHIDTASRRVINQIDTGKKRVNATYDVDLSISYLGSGNYRFTAKWGSAGSSCRYLLYINGVYTQDLGVHGNSYSFDKSTLGNYYVEIRNGGDAGPRTNTPVVKIISNPSPGTTPLLRYSNKYNSHHFYTSNWEEIGNGSAGYLFDGVEGHMYSQSNGLAVPYYRYFNQSSSDHYYTPNLATYSGYVYEGIVGYVSTTPNGTFPNALYQYNRLPSDHFYTITQGSFPGFNLDGVSCYIAP
jgi:hypothetical protein